MTPLPILAAILTIALAVGVILQIAKKRRRLAPVPVRIRPSNPAKR